MSKAEFRDWVLRQGYLLYSGNRWQRDKRTSTGGIRTTRYVLAGEQVEFAEEWISWERYRKTGKVPMWWETKWTWTLDKLRLNPATDRLIFLE